MIKEEAIAVGNKGAWRFYIFSLIGIFCFFVPITINGTNSIFVDHVHLAIRAVLGDVIYSVINDFSRSHLAYYETNV